MDSNEAVCVALDYAETLSADDPIRNAINDSVKKWVEDGVAARREWRRLAVTEAILVDAKGKR